MPDQMLDYRSSIRERVVSPWYRTDLATGAMTVGVILATNGWLVWNADKSWGFWLWVFFVIPVGNGVLAAVLIACSPIVRMIAGSSAALHRWVTLIGCASAIFLDAAIIFAQLHGC